MRRFAQICVFAGLLLATAVAAAQAQQGWGTIKGQVVWQGPIPAAKIINATGMPACCVVKGPLVSDKLIIEAKTKGVKNVMVWLVDPKGAMPIHPNLKAIPKQDIVIDQPNCLFEPRVTMMRAGQTLVIKNTAPIAHSAMLVGGAGINPAINLQIPPGGKIAFGGAKALKAEPRALTLSCSLHGWMAGKVGVFDHPYFAVTKDDGSFEIKDAPAGNFVIYIYHDSVGWLHTPRVADKVKGIGGSLGQPISIPAKGTLDLGKIKIP